MCSANPVGCINYIAHNGTVVERHEYSNADEFVEKIVSENFCGAPMTIAVYGTREDKDAISLVRKISQKLDPPVSVFLAQKKVPSESKAVRSCDERFNELLEKDCLSDDSDTPAAERFADVVYACDELKGIITFCNLVREAPSQYQITDEAQKTRDTIKRFIEAEAGELLKTSGVSVNQKANNFAKMLEFLVQNAAEEAVAKKYEEVKDMANESDIVWYSDLEYNMGRSWDEVPLPPCVEQAFESFISLLCEGNAVNGLLGSESTLVTEEKSIPDGAFGVGVYDLNDFVLVFDNEDHARYFFEHYGVEPMDLYLWTGDYWISL